MVDQTPALKAVIDELEKRLGSGTYKGYRTPQVIRPIVDGGRQRPELGYSQHSYRNASDIYAYGVAKQKPIVDELMRMKNQGYPVGTVLHAGNDGDHKDHVHVEGKPKVKGDPRKPSTWNISGGSGDYSNLPTGGTGQGNAESPTFDDIKPWDFIFNPGKVTEAAGDWFFSAVVLRVVFGLVAVVAFTLTVIAIIAAYKGEDIAKVAGLVATKGASA